MAEYARRIHHTTVTLDPGQSKAFRLPPMTPGAMVVNATVASITIPRLPPPGPTLPPRRTPLRAPVAPLSLTRRLSSLTSHAVPVAPRIDDPGGSFPPPETPTDLTMELLYGSQVVGTSAAHILFSATTKDDARDLRLTRRAGGTGTTTYVIEVNYPSVMPIVERRISPVAFQRAFDANWNQHPYVSVEVSPHYHVYVTFDDDFRKLYGLDNLDIDLGVPAAVPNIDRIKTTSIRFSIGHDLIPLPSNVVAPYQVPFVQLHVGLHQDGGKDSSFDLRFYLVSFSETVSYLTRVSSPILGNIVAIANQVPLVDLSVDDLARPIEAAIDGLGAAAFGPAITPWLQGEPDRDMFGLTFDTGRNEIVVKYIGRPPPPATDPVVLDPTRPPPAPDPNPRLFDTPDELPPPPPATSPLPGGGRITTSPGALASVNQIVVVMQENRSFDQVLGYLRKELGRVDVNGLSDDPNSLQLNRYDNGGGERIYRPQRAPETRWLSYDTPGPCHDFDCVKDQMLDGMAHFVSNFDKRLTGGALGASPALLQRVMDYFGADQLPAFAALARDFAICDAWHCAHAGPTWPNRFVTMTGDLNRSREGGVELNQPDFDHLAPLTAPTLFDHLTERGVSWRLYEHGYSFLRLYGRYTFDLQNIRSFVDPTAGFVADAAAGRLPQVTFIEPDYIDLPPGNDDHPPGDMADGQRFIATIVSALLDSPQWASTMLIITYDEHGGFYDHVAPPEGPPLLGDLRRYGPRVPAFVVSPFVGAGAVSHTLYDHTTIPATILRRFCSPHPPKLGPRADAANDLRDLMLPTARPRSAFNALHDQMMAVRNRPAPPAQPARKLRPWTDEDDFHSLLSYVRSFT